MNRTLIAFAVSVVGLSMACSSSDPTTTTESSSAALATLKVSSGGRVTGKIPRKASFTLNLETEGCNNHPGPRITWSGALALGSMDAQIIARNNTKGTHETAPIEATATVNVVPTGDIDIPKQPPLGGAGGNPWIYFQPTNAQGYPTGDAVLVGRCNQRSFHKTIDFSVLGDLVLDVDPADKNSCVNSGGPYITLTGSIDFGPINGKIIFQNKQVDPRHVNNNSEGSLSISITPDTVPFMFPKQPPLGGAGGNPLLYVQLVEGTTALTDLAFLGRCNKL